MRLMEASDITGDPKFTSNELLMVWLECATRRTTPGDSVAVKIVVSAGPGEISATGIFIDLLDTERIALRHLPPDFVSPFSMSHQAMNESFSIYRAFELAPDEMRIFEGKFCLPINFQPTFAGHFSRHDWQIRARVETRSGDFDSGFQPFIIGAGF